MTQIKSRSDSLQREDATCYTCPRTSKPIFTQRPPFNTKKNDTNTDDFNISDEGEFYTELLLALKTDVVPKEFCKLHMIICFIQRSQALKKNL